MFPKRALPETLCQIQPLPLQVSLRYQKPALIRGVCEHRADFAYSLNGHPCLPQEVLREAGEKSVLANRKEEEELTTRQAPARVPMRPPPSFYLL